MHQDCFLLSLFVQLRVTLLFSQMMKQKIFLNECRTGKGCVCTMQVSYTAKKKNSEKSYKITR